MQLARSLIYLKQSQMMLQDVLIYRADFISRFISWGTRFLVTVLLWTAVLKSAGGHIEGYDQKTMLTYFLLMQIVTGFIFGAVGFHVSESISTGSLSGQLVKPMHPLLLAAAADLGRNFFYFVSNILLYSLIAWAMPNYFSLSFSPTLLPWALVSLGLAYVSNTCFLIIIAELAFWTGTAERLLFVFFSIIHVLSGVMIPIDLFPEWLERGLYFTPFPYLFYVPVNIAQSTTWDPQVLQWIAVSLAYTIILLACTELMYRIGLKSYETSGQ